MFLSAMKVGQGTAQELMSQEEGNSRDIDTFVQQLHSESMPEAVEGDMFVDSGRLNQKRDFVIEDIRRKGREDCSLLPDWPQNGNCLLGKWYADFVPSFLDSDTHIIAPLLSFQILPPKSQQICAPKPTSDIEANSLFDFFILEWGMLDRLYLFTGQPFPFTGMIPLNPFNLLCGIKVY